MLPRRFPHALLAVAALLTALPSVAEPSTLSSKPVLKVETDRPKALYAVGETATFKVSVTPAAAATSLTCTFSTDGWQPQPAQQVPLNDGMATITGTLQQPGFLQLRVTLPDQKTTALAAAGFEPERIAPSLPVPADFDAFWSAQKAKLAAVPLRSSLTAIPTKVPGVEAFDLTVDCLGAPVSGYFGRPKNAKVKSLPAILFVHGAGVVSASAGSFAWTPNEGGMLTLDINAHGIPNGQPVSFYKEQGAGPLKDYRYVGRADREKSYFLGMFLRVKRALDFLTAQPEWDGKTLIAYGSSQGGFQAFAAAALEPRVSFFCAGVPAGCDHTGIAANRINGWPKLVTITHGQPNERELETARYFDAVNFATRARAKGAAVTVGLIDTTCPPTSVYAAYNALRIPKHLHIDPLAGHTNTPAAIQFMKNAALAHVREMRGSAAVKSAP